MTAASEINKRLRVSKETAYGTQRVKGAITGTAQTTSGPFAVGATSITIDNNAATGTINAGDYVTFSGDSTPYLVASNLTVDAGGTLSLVYGLKQAISSAKDVTVLDGLDIVFTNGGSNFTNKQGIIESAEVSSSTMVKNYDRETRKFAGTLNGELQAGMYDEFIASSLRKNWVTSSLPSLSGSVTETLALTVSGDTYKITSSTNSLISEGFKIGTVFRLSGAGFASGGTEVNLARNFIIVDMAANGSDLTFVPIDNMADRVVSSAVVTAGAFVTGQRYVILSAGTTDFTLVGAANSSVGTEFYATGAGTGTGTVNAVTSDAPIPRSGIDDNPTGTIAQYGGITYIPQSGHTSDSWTIEEAYTDVGTYITNLGHRFSGFTISTANNGIPTISFTTVGKTAEDPDTVTEFALVEKPATSTNLSTIFSRVYYNGSQIGCITKFDVTHTNNTTVADRCYGSDAAVHSFDGMAKVTGTLSLYFTTTNGASAKQLYLDKLEHDLVIYFGESDSYTADFMSIVLPRVVFTEADNANDMNGSQITMPFTAFENPTGDDAITGTISSTGYLPKSAIRIQSSMTV